MKWFFFLFSILLFGCVSESTYQEAIAENQVLKAELEELKYGIPNLLADAKRLYDLNSFSEAKEKIDLLTQNHPNVIETVEAKKMLPSINEEILWQKIETEESLDLIEKYALSYPKGKYSSKVYSRKQEILNLIDKDAYENAKSRNSITAYKDYLEDYPKGKYRRKARDEISTIKRANQESAYANAKSRNSSSVWENFLEDYPNHPEKNNIKKKIISLKVDEIMGDRNTGQLPTFSQSSYGYSSSSSVTIENDTGHELTVRYSGPSVKMIVIPRGSSRTTSLSSGSYKIAASAGGLNYAGRERLSGSYSSTYYISTTRY